MIESRREGMTVATGAREVLSAEGYPPNKEVVLRLMSIEGGGPVILARPYRELP